MSSKTLLLPLAAFIGSAAFLTWQHFAQVPIRQQATLFRGTVQAVTTHRAATQAKAVAASRSGDDGQAKTDPAASSTRPVIDLKEMATLMAGMQNGTMPDLKAMLKLQKTILELSSEELSTLITDAGQLELPPGQRNNLVMMLIQGLSESDPQAGRPCERGKFIALRLDPFRGSLFDLFHGGTDGDGATGFKENGDVIRDGIDEDGRAAKVLRDGRHTAGCKESRTVSCRGGARGSWC
jgi:hypothetical protein